MRIELEHKSNCPSSKIVRSRLEEIIAEEGLPIAVEMIESESSDAPTVRICSSINADSRIAHDEIKCALELSEQKLFLNKLRDIVMERWHDHAVTPLAHLSPAAF